jgi:RNA polymerase sigma factor (sigma-70 family)
VLQLVNHLEASYNLAKWLTQNEHDAEDVVQDAYLRAIRHFRSFQGGEGRAWLLTIVRNLCYDTMRRRNVHERTASFDEKLDNTCASPTPDPEACLLRKERAELLRQALAELPLDLREVLVLRELQELSYREIASIAQVPMGTVMSRLSRGRKRLQQLMLLPEKVEDADSQNTPAGR